MPAMQSNPSKGLLLMNRDDELGGLWLKTSQAGKKFMSGKLTLNGENVEVVVFKNEFKKDGERTPDYRVYRSQPREQQQQQQQPAASYARREPKGSFDDLDIDPIPF